MPSQSEKAQAFRALHVEFNPVVLYNIWDAGSANAVEQAGAKAIATGSWSVAAAQGYADGEKLPLDLALDIYARIIRRTDLPVSIDFEGGYATDPIGLSANIARLIDTGAVGLNFEDQVVGGNGLYEIDRQVGRIKAVRDAAEAKQVPAVINARTDLFLKDPDQTKHAALLAETLERGQAYADAGADCFFVPGLRDPDLITKVCAGCALPVNIMVSDTSADLSSLSQTGVGRISFGPNPYRTAMAQIAEAAAAHF